MATMEMTSLGLPEAWRRLGTRRRAARSADVLTERTQRPPWWHPLLRDGTRPLILAGDLASCAAAAWLTGTGPQLSTCFAVVLVTLFGLSGLYQSRLAVSVLDDLPRVVRSWLITVALMDIGSQILFSQFAGLPLAGFALGLVAVSRGVAYGVVRQLRRSRVVTHPTIVVGAGRTGRAMMAKIADTPESGLAPLGFLEDDPDITTPLPAPVLGGHADVSTVLARHQPRALIIADGHLSDAQMVSIIRTCHRHYCEFFVIPRLYEVTQVGGDMDSVGDVPLIRLRRAAYRSLAWQCKRAFDVAFSAAALIALAPVLLACAVAVRLEGGPGVIFRQERVGVDGRRFQVLKFRSLTPESTEQSQTQWNVAHDDRLGPVGRFLRKSSLDELPQLVNVLKGDMSLVGPRPERPHFVEEFDRLYVGYAARHRVPCGLTGWAQVNGLRGDTSIEKRARFDNFYIENWSLWLDLKILLRTFISVFTEPGT